MKRRQFALTATATLLGLTLAAGNAFAQTKWDLPAG